MRRDMSEVGDINTHILQREQRHEPKHEHDGTNNYSNSVQDSSNQEDNCLLYTSPSPRDATLSRMPSSA